MRLRQILVNLIGNAIKFTEKGEVAIKVELVKPRQKKRGQNNKVAFHFQVIDTGIGLSKANLKKIFEKFSQADTSTTREFGGTGLGLNISKSLIDLMGDKLCVDSKKGDGSTFHFQLELPVGEKEFVTDYSYPNFKEVTILVVDDNETNRFILRKTLSAWGFNVQEAQSGPQALSMLKTASVPIDLIFLDHQMPEDGWN